MSRLPAKNDRSNDGSARPQRSRVDLTPQTYRNDPLFPRIERAVQGILATKKFVAPVDVFIGMDILRAKDLEDWRSGRVPFLEQVILGNLSKLRRILRVLGM